MFSFSSAITSSVFRSMGLLSSPRLSPLDVFFACLSAFSYSPTLAAGTSRMAPMDKSISIFRREFMSVNTVSLSGIVRRRGNTSERINARCYGFNVNWINAISSTAKMISVKFGRDRVYEHLEGQPMCRVRLFLKTQPCVPVACNTAYPEPTGDSAKRNRWINSYVAEKMFKEFTAYGKAGRIIWNHLSLLNRFNGLGFRGLTHREALSF